MLPIFIHSDVESSIEYDNLRSNSLLTAYKVSTMVPTNLPLSISEYYGLRCNKVVESSKMLMIYSNRTKIFK